MSGYIAFCIKACAGGALALVLAVTPTAGPAAAPRAAPAKVSQPVMSLYTSAQAASLTTTAQALAPYLARQANGTLTLNAPTRVISGLPEADVQALGTGLKALNLKIANGELQTSAAGAVFKATADSFMFQGGWTGHGYDWWHNYMCLNHNDVQTLAHYGYNQLGNAGLLALGYFGGLIGFSVALVAFVYTGWLYTADHGNGSCLNFGHFPPPNIWVTSQ